jgi:hypothetical protein
LSVPTDRSLRRLATRSTGVALLLLGSSVACSSTAHAAQPARSPRDPFLAQLAGHWDLRGSVGDKPVRYAGDGRWVLRDGWLRLALVDVGKPPAYVADLYLGADVKAGGYIVHWLDQFGAAGARVVATGHLTGRTLVFSFPYEGSPFRDTLTLAADGTTGSLLIEAQRPDGSWSTFASYTLRRSR